MALRLMLMIFLLSGFTVLFSYQQMKDGREWNYDEELKKAKHYDEMMTRSSVHLYYPVE